MRSTMMGVWTMGLFVALLAGCGGGDDGGGDPVEKLCKKIVDCGLPQTIESCSDSVNMCANPETKAAECAAKSDCGEAFACYIELSFECAPEEDPTTTG